MSKGGLPLKLIIYTRTKNQKVNIQEIPIFFAFVGHNNQLICELETTELKNILNELNENKDSFEEITYCFSDDEKIYTWQSKTEY